MRTSFSPYARVLVVCGPTAPHPVEPLFSPVLFTRSRSATRWASRANSPRQPHGVYTSETRPLPRAPRGVQYGRPVARSRGVASFARSGIGGRGAMFARFLFPLLHESVTPPRCMYQPRRAPSTRSQGGKGVAGRPAGGGGRSPLNRKDSKYSRFSQFQSGDTPQSVENPTH